jgi:hypothetical protein
MRPNYWNMCFTLILYLLRLHFLIEVFGEYISY